VIAAGGVTVLALPGWTAWELHTRTPLVELRMLRQRSVLAGNLTGVLVAGGFYPFMSLVVRFVQTPPSASYGFGASTVLAGMMLTPVSAASFAARRPAIALARRTSPAWAIAASSLIIAAGQLLFLLTRSGYPSVIAAMTLTASASERYSRSTQSRSSTAPPPRSTLRSSPPRCSSAACSPSDSHAGPGNRTAVRCRQSIISVLAAGRRGRTPARSVSDTRLPARTAAPDLDQLATRDGQPVKPEARTLAG
jgi:hypothetical protein